MNARELSVRHLHEVTERPDFAVAQAQFITNLERQAAKERRDAELYEAWKVRQVKVQADIARERKMLAAGLGAGLIVGAVCAVVIAAAVVHFLAAFGIPLAGALALAVLLGGSSGCGCTVIVTHVCGH